MKQRRILISEALDWIIHQQRAVDFQRLAVQVAKTKWPELEATEIWSDNGEDATFHIPGKDGVRRVLACSLTGTLEKIRRDASRLREEGKEIDTLVFMTPAGIPNGRVARWRKAIQSEFGHDLHVIPRSELLALMERPEHEFICRDYLHLEPAMHGTVADPNGGVEITLGLAVEKKRELLSFLREMTPLLERFGVELIEVKRALPWVSGAALVLLCTGIYLFWQSPSDTDRVLLAKNCYTEGAAILDRMSRGSGDLQALDRARRAIMEAVDLWRGLIRDKGDGYEEELARALTTLGQIEAAAGRNDTAHRAYEEALGIYDRRSQDQEDRYAEERRTLRNRIKDLRE